MTVHLLGSCFFFAAVACLVGCAPSTTDRPDGVHDERDTCSGDRCDEPATTSSGAGTSTGDPPAPGCPDGEAAFETLAAEVEAELAAQGIPGGALAVVCDKERIFTRGFGVTTPGGDAVDEHTRFQIASMTKMFTAIVGAEMDYQQLVDLEAPITAHVPFLNTKAPYDRELTLAELLSHTSGFTAFKNAPLSLSLWDYFQFADTNETLWSPPGAVFSYNNLAYALAGLTLERAAGQLFADLVETRLFEPAGFVDSSMHAAAVESGGNFAMGHSSSGAPVMPTGGYLATPYYGPMGGAWSSAADMGRFAQILLKGGDGAMPEGVVDAMLEPRTPTYSPGSSYGLGMFVAEPGQRQFGHSGSVKGYLSSLDAFPDAGLAVVLLVNADWDLPRLSERALELFGGKELVWPDASPQPGDMEQHAGTYDSPNLGTFEVTKNGATLSIDVPTEGIQGELEPLWRDNYLIYVPAYDYDAVITFWRDSGVVQYCILDFGVGARVP